MVKSLVLWYLTAKCLQVVCVRLLLPHTVVHTRLIGNSKLTNYECRLLLASLYVALWKRLVHSVRSKWMNKWLLICYPPFIIPTINRT